MQLTMHEVPEQPTRLHAPAPVQLTSVVVALLETSAAHAPAPAQSTTHVFPLHEIGFVQEGGAAALLHSMSHNDASHTIGPVHAPAPGHPTLHSLPLHAIGPVHEPSPMQVMMHEPAAGQPVGQIVHEPLPTQLMMHELAAVQSIPFVHEPAPVHVTTHGMPGGQTTGPVVHEPAAMHTIVQVPPSSHVPRPASAQTEGHTSAASLGASPASASDRVPSPASASDGWPSPASFATRASPLWLASRTVASASIVGPASSPTRRLPSRARPQPKAINGMMSSTTPGRVRRSKTA